MFLKKIILFTLTASFIGASAQFNLRDKSNKNEKRLLLDCVTEIRDIQKIILSYLFMWQNITNVLPCWKKCRGKIDSLVFSPNEKYVLSCVSSYGLDHQYDTLLRVALWNTNTGALANSISVTGAKLIASSDLRSFVCVQSNGKSKLYDDIFCGHKSEFFLPVQIVQIRTVEMSPNGKYIAAGSTGHYPLTVYDAKNGKKIKEFKSKSDHYITSSIVFDSTSNIIAEVTDNDQLKIWDIKTGDGNSLSLEGKVRQACFSVNNELLIVLSSIDRQLDKLLFYKFQKRRGYEKVHACENQNIKKFSLSGNSKFLFFICYEHDYELNRNIYGLHVLDLLTYKEVAEFAVMSDTIAFSPHGSYIAQATKNNDIEILANQALEIENAHIHDPTKQDMLVKKESSSDCEIM